MYDKVELSEEFKKRIDNTYLISALKQEQESLISMLFDGIFSKRRKDEARLKIQYIQDRINEISNSP